MICSADSCPSPISRPGKTIDVGVVSGCATRDAACRRTLAAIRFALSTRRDLLLEVLALRHQLAVLARSNRRVRPSDRGEPALGRAAYSRRAEHETHQVLACERRHEQVAVPAGEHLAGVERDPRWRDVGRPEVHRLLHARLHGLVAIDRLAVVVAPVADDWEAVVLALLDLVDLVAATRTVLAGSERHAIPPSN
jgi:hypothetical protein